MLHVTEPQSLNSFVLTCLPSCPTVNGCDLSLMYQSDYSYLSSELTLRILVWFLSHPRHFCHNKTYFSEPPLQYETVFGFFMSCYTHKKRLQKNFALYQSCNIHHIKWKRYPPLVCVCLMGVYNKDTNNHPSLDTFVFLGLCTLMRHHVNLLIHFQHRWLILFYYYHDDESLLLTGSGYTYGKTIGLRGGVVLISTGFESVSWCDLALTRKFLILYLFHTTHWIEPQLFVTNTVKDAEIRGECVHVDVNNMRLFS